MNAASTILMKQFPELPLLQNTRLTSLHPAKEGSFFTTFVDTGPCQDLLTVYDSMQPRSLAPALIEQLHSLYGHLKSSKKIEIVLPQVQKQKGPVTVAASLSVSLMLGETRLCLGRAAVSYRKLLQYGVFYSTSLRGQKSKTLITTSHFVYLHNNVHDNG